MSLVKLSKKLYISIITLLVVVAGIYYYLGGFNKIEIAVVQSSPVPIGGQYFEGNYDSDTVRHLIDTVTSYLQRDTTAHLAVVNFDEYEDKAGLVRQFIGFTADSLSPPFSANIRVDTFGTQASIRATINRHFWVRPRPSAIRREIIEFAQMHELATGDYTIEQYISDRKMWVDVPITNK